MVSAREVIFEEVRLAVSVMNSWIKIKKSASLISVPVDAALPSIALVIIVVTSNTAWIKRSNHLLVENIHYLPSESG